MKIPIRHTTPTPNPFGYITDSEKGNLGTDTPAYFLKNLANLLNSRAGASAYHIVEIVCVMGFLYTGCMILVRAFIGTGNDTRAAYELKNNILRWCLAMFLFGALGGTLYALERMALAL